MSPVTLAAPPRRYSLRGVLALIVFTLCAPGIAFGIVFASIQIFPTREHNVKTPADIGFAYQTLSFTGVDGVATKGWYMAPPKAPAPVVIAVHGHRGRSDQFLKEARFLVDAGFGVVMFDLRQHGDSGSGVVTFGLREAEEIKPYLDHVRALPAHQGQKVGLIGWSMGAVTVLRATSIYPEVASVVADSPFASLSAQSRHRVSSIVPAPFDGYAWFFAMLTGCVLSRELPGEWEVTEWLPKIQPRPIFFIHGLDDTNIPPAATRRLVAAAKPENVEAWYTEHVRHIDSRNVHRPEYEKRVAAFFSRTLR